MSDSLRVKLRRLRELDDRSAVLKGQELAEYLRLQYELDSAEEDLLNKSFAGIVATPW